MIKIILSYYNKMNGCKNNNISIMKQMFQYWFWSCACASVPPTVPCTSATAAEGISGYWNSIFGDP